MDRFNACGSRRPSLISDDDIHLRLPTRPSSGPQTLLDGNYFSNGSSLTYGSAMSIFGQGSSAMLVDIARILGLTNKYLASGGVKGDSHFPWHAQSTLSKIRADLDCWAATTQESFAPLDNLFSRADSTNLVLSKLIFHLIHCLIYRPFLPVDLTDLCGSGQDQTWQTEATNVCFIHANAIVELIETGKNAGTIYWPGFVGYCLCTAGTVHVHGAHYTLLQEDPLFGNSADLLTRESSLLSDLRFMWAGIQHQHDTLQKICASHLRLIESVGHDLKHSSSILQMEEFFVRYPGVTIDGGNVSFVDVDFAAMYASQSSYDQAPNRARRWTEYELQVDGTNQESSMARQAKRRSTINTPLQMHATPSEEVHTTLRDQSSFQKAHENSQPHLHQQYQQPPQPPFPMTHAHDEPAMIINHEHHQMIADETLMQDTLSPTFAFSPISQNMAMQSANHISPSAFQGPVADISSAYRPEARADSAHAEAEDPFLSFLEQMVENVGYANGDPSQFDFPLHDQS